MQIMLLCLIKLRSISIIQVPKLEITEQSMNNNTCFILTGLLLVVIPIVAITNLVGNNDFQQAVNAPGWYSIYSGTVRLRYNAAHSTHAIDTLNSNTHEKICYNVEKQQQVPYQLSFDYFNDQGTVRGVFKLSWNTEVLQHKAILDWDTHRSTYTVYLSLPTNILCFEGWGEAQTNLIGVLIDNIMLIPYDVRYVYFNAVQSSQKLNFIDLVSNLTVASSAELDSLTQGTSVRITGTDYEIGYKSTNDNQQLSMGVEFLSQYGSAGTTIDITLPTTLRNAMGQLIHYSITSSRLPRCLYQPQSTISLVEESQSYLVLMTKIYNVCFKVIRVIAFSFLGLRYMTFFYFALFLGFLDVHYILEAARLAIGQIIEHTINSGSFGYFMKLLGFNRYDFGASYFSTMNSQLPSNGLSWALPYSVSNITSNLYLLLVDDLIITVFNTLKILLLYHVIFKSNAKMRTVLKPIKNEKIMLEYIILFPVVGLICGACWRSGWQVSHFYAKANYGISMALPCIAVFLTVAMFLGQWHRMNVAYNRSKMRYTSKSESSKIREGYRNKILLNFTETVTFIIVPLLIGLNYIYPSLIILLILTVLKMKLACSVLGVNRTFLSFIYVLSLIIQFLIVFSFLLPQIIESIPTFSESAEITWMGVLLYNSVSLLFLYVSAGFIQVCCAIYWFVRGLSVLQSVCANKVANQFEQADNEIKIEKQVQDCENVDNKERVQSLEILQDIKTINQLKSKVSAKSISKNSLQQISNPFIASPNYEKSIDQAHQELEKMAEEQDKVKVKREVRQARMTKVITMHHIEPAQVFIQQENVKERAKSASHQNLNKQIIVKKPKQGPSQKGLYLIKKLELSKPSQVQEIGLSMFGKVVVSNFEKEENFS